MIKRNILDIQEVNKKLFVKLYGFTRLYSKHLIRGLLVFAIVIVNLIVNESEVVNAASYKKEFARKEINLKKVKYVEDGIKLVWNKIPGVSGYVIYRREDDSSWEEYDVVTKGKRYTDCDIETGYTYEYAVRAYTYYNGKKIFTRLVDSDTSIIGLPDKVENVVAKYNGNTNVDIVWNKSEEASGYYIYRQIGQGEWEKIANIDNYKVKQYTDTVEECGKTFQYRVIPYEVVDDVLYEGFFEVKCSNAYSDSVIDVSYHNGKIKWAKVKNDGVDFAFIRVGRGEPSKKSGAVLDVKFHRNMKLANKNGIRTGVYFYSCARSVEQSQKEARFVVKQLKEYGDIAWPVVYDFESMYRRGFKYKNSNTKMIEAFCKIISDAGYEAVIYSDYEMLSKYTNYDKISKYGIWVAYWTYDTNRYPVDLKNIWFWQYSDKGLFNGIPSYTDKNVRFIN